MTSGPRYRAASGSHEALLLMAQIGVLAWVHASHPAVREVKQKAGPEAGLDKRMGWRESLAP